jgi:GxxExxY protein
MQVHGALSNRFPELIHQRSLEAMKYAGLVFQREVDRTVFYRDEIVGVRRVDILVDNAVLVELKATHEPTTLHHAQTINYLKAFRLEVGLLFNFGEKSLQFKRFIKSQRQLIS